MNIIKKKINGCGDSFFYDGEIATHKKKNGTVLSLIATGEIRITIKHRGKDYIFRDNDLQEAIEQFKLTDKKLQRLSDNNKIEWIFNNWFEVTYLKKNEEFWDCDIGTVAHNYDDAIELLKSYETDDEY